jgi:hypothetical protein
VRNVGDPEKAAKICHFVLYHPDNVSLSSKDALQRLSQDLLFGRFETEVQMIRKFHLCTLTFVKTALHDAWLLRSILPRKSEPSALASPATEPATFPPVSPDSTARSVDACMSSVTRRTAKFGQAVRFIDAPGAKNSEERHGDENQPVQRPRSTARSPLRASISQSVCPFPQVEIQGRPYFELCLIGKGATAQVFKVVDAEGILYALKKVHHGESNGTAPRQAEDALALLADVTREIQVMKKCRDSPFVIQLLAEEYCQALSTQHILMEYGEMDAGRLLEENSIDISHWIQVHNTAVSRVAVFF